MALRNMLQRRSAAAAAKAEATGAMVRAAMNAHGTRPCARPFVGGATGPAMPRSRALSVRTVAQAAAVAAEAPAVSGLKIDLTGERAGPPRPQLEQHVPALANLLPHVRVFAGKRVFIAGIADDQVRERNG
jgi:hypothetical protein